MAGEPDQQFVWPGRQSLGLARAWSRLSIPIAYKLALCFAVVILLAMAILAVVVVSYQTDLMRRQINAYGSAIVGQYAAASTELLFTDDAFGLKIQAENLVTAPRILGASIYDDQGRVIAQAGVVPERALALRDSAQLLPGDLRVWQWQAGDTEGADASLSNRFLLLQGLFQRYGLFQHDDSVALSAPFQLDAALVSFMAPVSFNGVVAGQALVTFSSEDVSRSFHQTLSALVGASLLMITLILALAYGLSRRMARPIQQLVVATDQLARGRYDFQLQSPSNDEIGRLTIAVKQMAEHLRDKQMTEAVLARVVDGEVAQQMLADLDQVNVGSESVDASVLFVDIVGFTALAERLSPAEVVALLNEYFACFTYCSRLFFGSVDKFIGDCAMVVFGAPKQDEDHRFNAMACAVLMQQLFASLNQRRQAEGLPSVEVRIGINSGEMMAGMLGAEKRMEYTVVGDAVNLASRLASMAQPGEILAGENTYMHTTVTDRITAYTCGEVAVKGKQQAVQAYAVTAASEQYQYKMRAMIADILQHRDQNREG